MAFEFPWHLIPEIVRHGGDLPPIAVLPAIVGVIALLTLAWAVFSEEVASETRKMTGWISVVALVVVLFTFPSPRQIQESCNMLPPSERAMRHCPTPNPSITFRFPTP